MHRRPFGPFSSIARFVVRKLPQAGLLLSLFFFSQCELTTASPEQQYQKYCGNCHLAPAPKHIPQHIWADPLLPEMAARLGYKYNDYNPLARNSMEENLYIRLSQTYPEQPLIDSSTWRQIYDYVMQRAPEQIPSDSTRQQRHKALTQFTAQSLDLLALNAGQITTIHFTPDAQQFIIGDATGAYAQWPDTLSQSARFNSPVISYQRQGEDLYVTEIGYMHPSDKPRGSLYRINDSGKEILAQELHRPVFTEVVDLDQNGTDEILICEFGNLRGTFSMLHETERGLEKRDLLPVAGTIKFELTDLDRDGRQDILVLASQGNEGIFVCYQTAPLQFRVEQLIQLPPEYGSSWFELIDYNGDEHLDIVLVNGDNADLSHFPKPYHGLRLFLNDGQNQFTESWFYPIYGATRVLADDYDGDGDMDFAVLAFFPDYEHSTVESFIYLENQLASQFEFASYTFPAARDGRWLVMEKGDFDQDQDVDLLLGSFILPPESGHRSSLEHWINSAAELMILENTLNK